MSGTSTFDLSKLRAAGFEIDFHGHAGAILGIDFQEALIEIEAVLINLRIPIVEIIAGGGGESKGTQRLRKAMNERGWIKRRFEIKKTINDEERESVSHEMDHVREFAQGNVVLEIEWNNKDPFLDRDLENFKRLHSEGAISVGIIVTRGRSLQDQLRGLVERFVQEQKITSFKDLEKWGYEPTVRQRREIEGRVERKRNRLNFAQAFVGVFVSDKFSESTTHWRKLEDRIRRGVGNPCPLMLIGLPASIVTFDEAEATIRELQNDEEPEDGDLFDWSNSRS